jgi:hypothetical protein
MACSLMKLSLASLLFLASLCQPSNIPHAKSSDKTDTTDPPVTIKDNKVIIRSKPSEVVHRKRFFQADECKLDDGLIILFKDGEISASVIDKALTGGRMTTDTMTFRIGTATCEVAIQIQKYKGHD